MVVTIKNEMTPKQAMALLDKAQERIWQEKRQKKIISLKKLGGLLAHLKMSPMEMQKELRDGWLE